MRLRILSALILAPPILAAFYFGSPYLEAVVALAAAILAWEWARLCGPAQLDAAGILMIVATTACVILVAAGAPGLLAPSVALAGAVATAAAAAVRAAGVAGRGLSGTAGWYLASWYLGGGGYIGLCCMSLLWLHQARPEGSALLMFWLLLTVWATDCFAYFVGRAVGGPKLAPRISPRKTWAGLVGGMVAACVVGAVVSAASSETPGWPLLAALSGLLAVVAQCGDLAISAVKRHFGAKDSGALIPGHGGLFDRVDGLMAAALVLVSLDRLGQVPI